MQIPRPAAAALLLLGATRAQETLDLFVREKFDGPGCTGECSEDLSGGCHLATRSFFLSEECFNRSDERSSLYGELRDGSGLVCRRDFRDSCESDEDLVFDAEEEGDCRDSWPADECVEGEIMKKYSKWCVRSDVPTGEYVIPLIFLREYDDVDSCKSSDYQHLLLPDEKGACLPLSLYFEGEFVSGSRRVECDGASYVAKTYPTDDCTGDAMGGPFDGSTDECLDEEPAYTNDCAGPGVFCKSADFMGGSTEIETDGEASEAGASGATVGEGSTKNGGVVVRMTAPGAIVVAGAALLRFL